MEEPPAQETDLLKLVDRYKAMLDDIAGYKMRGAALGGSPAAGRKMRQELDRRTKEAEELEREIDGLRARILAREAEIRRLGKRELP